MKILWMVVFAVTFGFIARATPLEDKVKNFADALKSAGTGKDVDPTMESRMPALEDELKMSMNTPNGGPNIEAMVKQLMLTNPSPAVQAAGKALLAELAAQKKAHLEDQTAQVSAVLARVPPILIKAQKPQDLDGILAEIQKAEMPQGGMNGYDQDIQALTNRLNNAYQFVAQWQDYLSQRNSGNIQAAQSTLQNLLNSRSVGDSTLVPRSEILARAVALAGPAKATAAGSPSAGAPAIDEESILAGVKTLDDMEPAIRALRVAQPQDTTATQQLSQMVDLYAEAKNGLPVPFDFSAYNYNPGTTVPGLVRIKSMLILYLLPRYLGNGVSAPNANETVNNYLQRIVDAAETKEDWSTLQRIITAETRITRLQINPSGSQSFLAGLNQEMAGQYAFAVTSYESALRQPDDFLPVKVVGDRLATIKKDHPADFDAGMKSFQNPPTPAYPNPYLMRGGYPPAYMIPGYPNPAAMRAAVTAAAEVTTNAPAVTPPPATTASTPATPPATTNAAPAPAPTPK